MSSQISLWRPMIVGDSFEFIVQMKQPIRVESPPHSGQRHDFIWDDRFHIPNCLLGKWSHSILLREYHLGLYSRTNHITSPKILIISDTVDFIELVRQDKYYHSFLILIWLST